jgi:hypothetical protein
MRNLHGQFRGVPVVQGRVVQNSVVGGQPVDQVPKEFNDMLEQACETIKDPTKNTDIKKKILETLGDADVLLQWAGPNDEVLSNMKNSIVNKLLDIKPEAIQDPQIESSFKECFEKLYDVRLPNAMRDPQVRENIGGLFMNLGIRRGPYISNIPTVQGELLHENTLSQKMNKMVEATDLHDKLKIASEIIIAPPSLSRPTFSLQEKKMVFRHLVSLSALSEFKKEIKKTIADKMIDIQNEALQNDPGIEVPFKGFLEELTQPLT